MYEVSVDFIISARVDHRRNVFPRSTGRPDTLILAAGTRWISH